MIQGRSRDSGVIGHWVVGGGQGTARRYLPARRNARATFVTVAGVDFRL
jgi:hypothetical protein